jgi:hypothetical protein
MSSYNTTTLGLFVKNGPEGFKLVAASLKCLIDVLLVQTVSFILIHTRESFLQIKQ